MTDPTIAERLTALNEQIDETSHTLWQLRNEQHQLQLQAQETLPAQITPDNVLEVNLKAVLWAGREREAEQALQALCEQVGGVSGGGIDLLTDRINLRVCIRPSDPPERQHGLLRLLPRLHPNEHGRHVLQIDVGHQPEPGAFYQLTLSPDGQVAVDVSTDVHREHIDVEFIGPVPDALSFIARHHPYQVAPD